MQSEFVHRGIRASVVLVQDEQLAWTIFPTARAEITGIVSAAELNDAARLAISEACDEIDAWLDAEGQEG